MATAGKVPIRESVGAALRYVREHARFIGAVALAGAAAIAALSYAEAVAPALGPPINLAALAISAGVYAALTGAVLGVGGGQRLAPDGLRVLAAMVAVGFFLCIVFIVLLIPGVFVLGMVYAPHYGPELQAVGQDQAAAMALLTRIAQEQPGPLLAMFLFYGAVWLALTSRLYLAAPASIENRRILTFETWSWTKGNMLRIVAARLMLLAPAYVLVSAVTLLAGLALGADVLSPEGLSAYARANPAGFVTYTLLSSGFSIALYLSLEAGLSAYLYRGLKPNDAAIAR